LSDLKKFRDLLRSSCAKVKSCFHTWSRLITTIALYNDYSYLFCFEPFFTDYLKFIDNT
jgi:hypothetical protein